MSEFLAFAQANVVLIAIFVVLVAIIVGAETHKLTKSYHDVGPDEAVRLINREDAVVLDVRESAETAGGTIHGAKHIPTSTLEQRLGEIETLKETPLLAFCASGVRAPGACRLLTKRGFIKVYHLKGGLAAWQQADMPIVKK